MAKPGDLGSTNRIAGGAPAGMSILPGELGCLTNKTRIKTMTRSGKTMTTPSGTETVELPRRRRGRRKNASCEARPFRFGDPRFSLSRVGSRNGWADEAILDALRIRSMVLTNPPQWQGRKTMSRCEEGDEAALTAVFGLVSGGSGVVGRDARRDYYNQGQGILKPGPEPTMRAKSLRRPKHDETRGGAWRPQSRERRKESGKGRIEGIDRRRGAE